MEDAMEDVFEDEENVEQEEQIVNQVLDELQINLDQQLVDAPGTKKNVNKVESKDKELEARMGNLWKRKKSPVDKKALAVPESENSCDLANMRQSQKQTWIL